MNTVKNLYIDIDKSVKEFTHPYRIYKGKTELKFSQCFDLYSHGASAYRESLLKGENVELRVYSYGKGFKILSSFSV